MDAKCELNRDPNPQLFNDLCLAIRQTMALMPLSMPLSTLTICEIQTPYTKQKSPGSDFFKPETSLEKTSPKGCDELNKSSCNSL
jgi:hypothetical protein